MGLPLFNFFDISDRWQLLRSLRDLGPARCWNVMSELYAADQGYYLADPGVAEEHDRLVKNARTFMSQAPALRGRDIEAMATRYGSYGPRLQMETLFLLLWMRDRGTLFGEVVETRGREHLLSALDSAPGVLALPVHLGPSYAIGPMLAYEHPATMVFNRINFDECKELTFPQLDAEAFALGSRNVAHAGIKALRGGRVFSMFPELDPRGVDQRHVRVPFLGTTVMVPTGPVVMSRISGAPMLPISLESNNDGTFVLEYHAPVSAPVSRDEHVDATLALWKSLDDIILSGTTEDWEIWFEFNKMVPEHS